MRTSDHGDLRIRPLVPGDSAQIQGLLVRSEGERPAALPALSTYILEQNASAGVLVAVASSMVVGFAGYSQDALTDAPGRYIIEVLVAPEYRRKGIGTVLLNELVLQLRGRGATELQAFTREDNIPSPFFLERRGFVQVMRRFQLTLALDPADHTLSVATEQVPHQSHCTVSTVAALRRSSTPNLDDRLLELINQIRVDVPRPYPFVPSERAAYEEEWLAAEGYLPEAWFVAIRDNVFVGMHTLTRRNDRLLWSKLTGVLRQHRHLGIARSLKYRGIAYARQAGYHEVRTSVATTNDAMIALNVELGFRHHTTEVEWALRLRHLTHDRGLRSNQLLGGTCQNKHGESSMQNDDTPFQDAVRRLQAVNHHKTSAWLQRLQVLQLESGQPVGGDVEARAKADLAAFIRWLGEMAEGAYLNFDPDAYQRGLKDRYLMAALSTWYRTVRR